jgi:hypothetical protein
MGNHRQVVRNILTVVVYNILINRTLSKKISLPPPVCHACGRQTSRAASVIDLWVRVMLNVVALKGTPGFVTVILYGEPVGELYQEYVVWKQIPEQAV